METGNNGSFRTTDRMGFVKPHKMQCYLLFSTNQIDLGIFPACFAGRLLQIYWLITMRNKKLISFVLPTEIKKKTKMRSNEPLTRSSSDIET